MNAKCLCGYEHECGLDDEGNWGTLQGDEPFLEVLGDFHTRKTDIWGEDREIHLLACPKCGTVRIERKW